MIIDWTWQVEALASIAACAGIGILVRNALARLDHRKRQQ
jgi:hypothetical protein